MDLWKGHAGNPEMSRAVSALRGAGDKRRYVHRCCKRGVLDAVLVVWSDAVQPSVSQLPMKWAEVEKEDGQSWRQEKRKFGSAHEQDFEVYAIMACVQTAQGGRFNWNCMCHGKKWLQTERTLVCCWSFLWCWGAWTLSGIYLLTRALISSLDWSQTHAPLTLLSK